MNWKWKINTDQHIPRRAELFPGTLRFLVKIFGLFHFPFLWSKKNEELLSNFLRTHPHSSWHVLFWCCCYFHFHLFQVFSSGPLFALPYCHQFLAPIKTILSWHHKITFFCRWTFPVSFWDKTCVDNSGTLVYTGEQRCGIYQSTTTIRKHDMFSGPFQRSNVIIEFHPFLIQARLPYLEDCQKSIER